MCNYLWIQAVGVIISLYLSLQLGCPTLIHW
jgi:hypothetical protein